MPLRRSAVPRGLDMQLYRRLRFGRLASVHVLDTRQYRSDQPATLADASDPALTMTGPEQERWLVHGLRSSGSSWNLLANQVMWASNDRRAGPEQVFDLDNWDGYRAQRRRLLEFFGSGQVDNPVVLTGDRHCTWVCDLKPDFDDPASPVVGAEITGTSITSGGNANPAPFHATYDPIMAESPHWKYIDNQRGYVVCDVTPERMLSSLRLVDTVWAPTAAVRTAAQFVVESGRPGISVVSQEAAPPAPLIAGPRFATDDDQP
jgi:alkaline phosphatase D